MYHTILFDLDGTLTDPGIGITNSAAYALHKFGIHVSDRSKLYHFIGPPLLDSFMEVYGFSETDAQTAVTYYREYFQENGIFENVLYCGITDLLHSLCQAGCRLFLATSKPEIYARQILEHFEIEKYFTFIAGAKLDGTRSSKEDVIAYALKSGQISDLADAVMVGDRRYDITAAKRLGLDSVGVLFGYGSREELETAGASYLAERVSDILPLLLSAT